MWAPSMVDLLLGKMHIPQEVAQAKGLILSPDCIMMGHHKGDRIPCKQAPPHRRFGMLDSIISESAEIGYIGY